MSLYTRLASFGMLLPFGLLAGCTGDESSTTKRYVGKPAWEIVGADANGRTFRLSDYRGKVVLLQFWREM